MDNSTIVIRGAREHNLRNINLELPRNQLIVFTGVSGSGKSSLAFDTLYAEGQRRYIESLSSYARQFLGQMRKPDVDYLAGLSPSISIQQKTAGRNPRSTVGTITEIYDYLRVLYARVGQGHCPECGRPITAQSREQILARILALPSGTRCYILAPVVRGQKGEYKDLFADMLKRGFVRARADGQIIHLTDQLQLDRQIKHHIEIVVDRLKIDPKQRPRFAEAVEQGLALGEGNLIITVEAEEAQPAPKTAKGAAARGTQDLLFSAHYACTHCGKSYEPPSPQLFSFNSPQGMCLDCDGLGIKHDFDPALLIPDPAKSFAAGAVEMVGPLRAMGRWRRHIFEGIAETLGIDLEAPWKDLSRQQRDWLLLGSGERFIRYVWRHRGGQWHHGGKWEGIIPQLMSSFKKTAAGPRRAQLEKYMRSMRCPSCHGQRLNPQARAVRVAGKTLVEVCAQPVGDLEAFFAPGGTLETGLEPIQQAIAGEVLKEIRGRLQFLLNVGLHYLSLERSAPTLSGGEAQRIRLAGQIGCGLVGVLYILDEPSIGLHPRDNDRLLRSLEQLRDIGNTVIVVEHDEETMRAANFIVDFGPGPGVRGGEVVATGSLRQITANGASLTGQYLSGVKSIPIPPSRRPANKKRLKVVGAEHNNLKNIDVEFPLGQFICVTGVSGSGKSSLVNDVLLLGLKQLLGQKNGEAEAEEHDEDDESTLFVGKHKRLVGAQHIDKVIAIDQSPIGRTPRSNPATYIKVFDAIRDLFAQMPQAKVRGYKPGRFSFNVPGGRCEACQGNGSNRLEMDFLADVWLTCPVCEGRRFNRETLQVRFKDKNIHDVLEMDVQEALEHFADQPRIQGMLQTLHDVGLDYLKLGQPSPSLSGGEAQRIKLARELCRRSTGQTFYILDEPTTGLHFDDISKLLRVLHGFVDQGNTVVVIEHNLDVVKTADWIIDLGPDGGAGGGKIVAAGTPEAIAACTESFTGQALQPVLDGKSRLEPASRSRKPAAVVSTHNSIDGHITHITVKGAREHNLKDVSVSLPREAMSVCCGPSGSGKSSLAIDTIYAEGQRRYVESLSAYARQFLGQMQKPKVEHVGGLSPAISIEQKTTSKSPRSTVGTVTEVYDYLRILFARLGQPYCPKCQLPIGTQTADEIIDRILSLPEGTKLYLMAPVERRGQEQYDLLWDEIRRSGFVRMRVDGVSHTVDDPPSIDHRRKHQIEVIVDRVIVRANQRGRIADAVEAALDLGRGVLRVAHVDDKIPEPKWRIETYSQHLACDQCGRSYEPLHPQQFSFNSPLGWCPACEGLGVQQGANPAALIRDPRLSLRQGAIATWPPLDNATFRRFAEAIADHAGFKLDTPFEQLEPRHQRVILHGAGDDWIDLAGDGAPLLPRFQYKGLFPAIDEATRISHFYRYRLDYLVSAIPCMTCDGSRLRADAAAARFMGKTIGQIGDLPLEAALDFFKELKLSKAQQQVAGELLREIRNRLQFLVDVGLEYLTLNRSAPTLSGGEAQRIRLASQIGSGLTGVLYVLDEPTIGLHPRDNRRLIKALTQLRDLGNTLLLVEHDREVIDTADYLLDFGPGAGDHGGEIVAQGSPKQIRRMRESLTGQYLAGKQAIPVPTNRRMAVEGNGKAVPPAGAWLTVKGARHNNLQNIDVAFPLGALIVVTGVSGSGKSSLVNEVLYNTLARKLHRARTMPGAHEEILGLDNIDKVINVDQSPIGNSPSSNPATYTGVFDLIRQLFAQLPDAKIRGYHPRRFSFNKPGGRCEACEGMGQKKIEMHFLPDVWVECDICHGTRFSPETLQVRYKEHNISDVLNMRVSQALELFKNIPKIRQVLQTLADVGLDYVALGQSAPTFSGGEAQRVKLAAELARPSTGRTVYILDEPTTGLHFDDIRKLLDVLHRLVDLGNTVIVVEHNLDVIKTADWLIDLGPEAGAAGGKVVAEGTPEKVASARAASHTAPILAEVLAQGPRAKRTAYAPQAPAATGADEIDLDAVGKNAKMPWEVNGRRWHTVERISRTGKPTRWEGAALDWVVTRIHELGQFGETDWNDRSQVEITGAVKSHGWFLHASTGEQWLLWLTFRVGRNTFKPEDLRRRLGLLPAAATPGLETSDNSERVRVKNQKGPWQSVEIGVHSLKEVDTPVVREFLAKAVDAFHANLRRMQTKPEDLMPWKINGERWHLSDKGFPIGKKVLWERSLLKTLLAIIRELVPDVEIHWNVRDHMTLRPAGAKRIWARWKTKLAHGLECFFAGKKGQFNLSRLERIGLQHEIVTSKTDGDVVRFLFRTEDDLRPLQLKELLMEQLRGFEESAR